LYVNLFLGLLVLRDLPLINLLHFSGTHISFANYFYGRFFSSIKLVHKKFATLSLVRDFKHTWERMWFKASQFIASPTASLTSRIYSKI